VKNSKKVAVKNLSIIEPYVYPPVGILSGAVVGIGAVPDISHYDVVILRDPESEHSCGDVEIIARMDQVLYQGWTGGTSPNIIDIGNPSFMINLLTDSAVFSNIHLDPHELGLLDLLFYPNNRHTCKYHVIQRNSITGEIIGGKAYEINFSNSFRSGTEEDSLFANRRNLFRLDRDSTDMDTTLNLSRIESIHPNPATDQITVTYRLHEVANASISISNYYFTSMYDNYVLDINARSRTFNIQHYTTGFYIVTLVCDGKVADVKTFIKH